MRVRIALAGNPNSGKTTLFNALTGSNQFVGNWPGVTVEKKEGKIKGYTTKGEKNLVEMGAASYDKDGNFVLNNVNAKGWEDWATVLSAGLSVLGLAFGIPIMPINFRKITNKDERDAKIRELQQQYMDIKAGNAGKVEDVKSSAEAGKVAKDNKENI